MRATILCLAIICCASMAAATNPLSNIPITGGIRGTTGTVKGAMTLLKANKINGVVLFDAQLDNVVLKLADGSTKAVGSITLSSSGSTAGKRKLLQLGGILPPGLLLGGIQSTCDLLKLDIGPVKLNIGGVDVDIDAIHVEVGASGGTLGNLLCSITNLLGGLLSVDSLVSQLNSLISGLAGGLLSGLVGGLLGGLLG